MNNTENTFDHDPNDDFTQFYTSAQGTTLAPGEFLDGGNYRLEKKIGEGGMAQVWLAAEISGGRELRKVVCKLLPRPVQTDSKSLEQIEKVFALTQGLNHPNICPIYGMKSDPTYGWFFVMGYADGQTLEKWFQEQSNAQNGLPLPKVLKILKPLASALDFAHTQDVIHRDVKPQNVMFTGPRQTLWLLDFGIASKIHSTMTATIGARASSGTPHFMAPEQWLPSLDPNSVQDERSDQYSLGIIAYYFLSGQLPFSGDFNTLGFQVLNIAPPPIPQASSSVNSALLKALAKDRHDRFTTCDEFVRALGGNVVSVVPSAPPVRPKTVEELQREFYEKFKAEEAERERLEAEKRAEEEDARKIAEAQRLAREQLEAEKRAKAEEARKIAEAQRLARERLEAEKRAKEEEARKIAEAQRLARERLEAEKRAKEEARKIAEVQRLARERLEAEKRAKEEEARKIAEVQRLARERLEAEKRAKEEEARKIAETQRLARERLEAEKRAKVEAKHKAGELLIRKVNGVEYRFRWCPAGTFTMGSPKSEWDSAEIEWKSYDETQHEVTLTQGFWMLETEVTQEQWQAIMGNNPSYFKGKNLPVEQVSWNDCQEFCEKFNAASGLKINLPTEAQWEYACRAGTTGTYAGNLNEMGWYGSNSGSETHEVGQKKPNAWGLYDMHGNVWEWCLDWYDSGYYAASPTSDPLNSKKGAGRVYRGGSWPNNARNCRSAYRFSYTPDIRYYFLGFRPLLVLSCSGSGN